MFRSQSSQEYNGINTVDASESGTTTRPGVSLRRRRRSWTRWQRLAAIACTLFAATALFIRKSSPEVNENRIATTPAPSPTRPRHYHVTRPKPKLYLDSSTKSSFKILQIADLHLGERSDPEYRDWGPGQDRKTFQALDAILTSETNIDLIVLSGDQLTADNVDANATAYYQQLGDFLSTYYIPWAVIFGNHDDAAYKNQHVNAQNVSNVTRTPAKTSRQQLTHIDQSFPLSLSHVGPSAVYGTSNYVVPIYKSQEGDELAAQVMILDSGGGSLAPRLNESQVDWFQHQRRHSIPALVFQHIPLRQFLFQEGKDCAGINGDGNIDPVHDDGGMMEALMRDGNVWWVAVGHNHGNDYCCRVKDSRTMNFCFGRHSGYGGYGTWDRGARVYELDVDNDLLTVTGWRSWVRMESGEEVDVYNPTNPAPPV